MKALTIKQPWASLIVHGIKDIENRSWPCPEKYIGQRILIHTSATSAGMRNPNSVFTKEQWNSFSLGYQREIICGDGFPTSAIIGSVEIVDCMQNHPSIWAEKSLDNKCPKCRKYISHYLNWDTQVCIKCGHICKQGVHYAKPVYNWVLANPILFDKPIQAKVVGLQ